MSAWTRSGWRIALLRACLHSCVLHLPHPNGAAHLREHVLTRAHRLFLPRRADCLQAGGYFNSSAVLSPSAMACPAAAASATTSCTGATGVAVNIEVQAGIVGATSMMQHGAAQRELDSCCCWCGWWGGSDKATSGASSRGNIFVCGRLMRTAVGGAHLQCPVLHSTQAGAAACAAADST